MNVKRTVNRRMSLSISSHSLADSSAEYRMLDCFFYFCWGKCST